MKEIIKFLSDPEAASPILMALAQIAIMVGGFSLLVASWRRFAIRLLLLGVFLVVAAVVVPDMLR